MTSDKKKRIKHIFEKQRGWRYTTDGLREREREIFFFYLLFLFLLLLVHFCFYFFLFRFNKTKRKIEESILSSPARRRNYCPSRDGNHLGRFDTIDILMSLIVHHFNTLFLSPFLEEKIKDKINPIGEHHACGVNKSK